MKINQPDNDAPDHPSHPDRKSRRFSLEELEQIKKERSFSLSEAADYLGISPDELDHLVSHRHAENNHAYHNDFSSEKYHGEDQGRESAQDVLVKTIIGLANSNKQNTGDSVAFYRMILGGIIFIATTIVLLVAALTFLFLLFPSQTAVLFGYQSSVAQPLQEENTNTQVLGAQDAKLFQNIEPPLPVRLLRPFSRVSLEIVKRVDKEKYNRILNKQTYESVHDLFSVDENGNIVPRLKISLPDKTFLTSDAVFDVDVRSVLGRSPGTRPGDLVVFGDQKTIDGLSVLEENLTDGSVTGGLGGAIADGTISEFDIADGTITEAKLAAGVGGTPLENSVTSTMIIDSAIKGVDIADGAISTTKLAASTLTVSAGDGLSGGGSVSLGSSVSLSLDTTTSSTTTTTSSNSGLEVSANGLRLLGGCTNSQVLKWNSGAALWECGTVSGGDSLSVKEGNTEVDATVTSLDFLGGDFDLTESPEDEINIQLAATLTSVTGVAGDFTITGGDLTVGSSAALSDASGVLTLQNVDGLDATTESTIESAVDTLGNLTSASSLVTVGTLTGGATGAGFTLNFGTSTLSGNVTGSNIDESTLAGLTTANFTSSNISQWTNNSGYLTTVDISANTNLSASDGITLTGDALTNSDKGSTQNIFKTIAVSGQSDVVTDANADTLTLVAGSNVTLTTDATGDSVTIAATDTNTTYSAGNDLDLTGTTFALETTLDFVDTITFAGTGTLNGLDAIDATTESTIESAIDTLSNLTLASSLATVGTLTGGATGAGFTLNFGSSTLSGNVTGTNISGVDVSDDTNLSASNGVTLIGDALSLSSTSGGDGLTYTTGVLAVGAGTGISVAADSISATLGTSIANSELDIDTIDLDKVADTLVLDTDLAFTAGTGEEVTLDKTFTDATAENGFVMNFTTADTTSGTTSQFGLYLDNLPSTEGADALLVLDNSDTDDAVGAALKFINAGGGFTNLFDVAGTLISNTEFTILDSGIALSELTDSGTLTAGTVDINGGTIDGVTIGGSSAGSGTFTTVTASSTMTANGTLDANGAVTLGDGGDSITIDGASLGLQTTGAGSDITLNAVDQIILTDFANCTALETSSGVLTCGTDDLGVSGSQTPWTADIDADGFDLTDLSNIEFRETTGAPAGSAVALYRDNTGDMSANVLTGKTFNIAVNGTDEYNFSSTGLSLNSNNVLTGNTTLSATELDLLDSGVALSELTDSGTLTAGTVDINGGAIDGVTIGANTAGAGTFTTLTATGDITFNDGGADTILIGQAGATDDTVTIAGNISLTDDQWSIDGTGAASGLSGTNTSLTAGDVSCTNCLGSTEIAGIDISDDTNLSASNGVTLTGDALSLSSTAGGDGLTYTTGVLAVGAGTGISVAADSISATLGTSIANTELDTNTIDLDKVANTLSLDADLAFTAGAGEDVTLNKTFTDATSENGAVLNFTAADTTSGTTSQFGLYLDNLASTEGVDSLLVLDNSDTDDAVGAAIKFIDAGGTFTSLFDISGTLLSTSEVSLLDSGIALSELTDSGTLTAGTVDINGGAIDGTVLGANSAAAGTFTTVTLSSTLDANGQVDLGDGGDAVTINGSSLGLQTTGAGSDITLNAVDQIILTDFANCTALETSSGVLTCGTDDSGGSQTPWTADIDADGFDLTDLSNVEFRETTGAPAGSSVALYRDNSGDLSGNVLTGKTFNIGVNGTDEYNFSSSAFSLNSNSISTGSTTLTTAELDLLDTHDVALVDTNDAVGTAITGTGTLTSGATGAGFTISFTNSTLSGNVTGANISGVDVSDDTNLSASNGVTLTGDALSLNVGYNPTWTADHTFSFAEAEDLAIDIAISGTQAGQGEKITVTNSSSSGIQYGLYIDNAASTGTTDALVYLDNSDTDTVVTSAIQIANSSRFTNVLDIGGTTLTATEINLLDSGVALSELSDSGTLTAGTVDINGGAIDGVTIGGSSAGAGTFTTFATTGVTTIGNNSATVAINSSDWDIDTTGAITGVSLDANGTGNAITNIESADIAANTLLLDDIADTLALDADLAFTAGAGEDITVNKTFTNNAGENGSVMNFTASDTGSSTTSQYGLYLDNLASTEGVDSLLVLDNSDTDDTVGAAIKFIDAGGTFTSLFDIAGTLLSSAEVTLLNDGVALSELTDSGTLTVTTADINGGSIDGVTIGGASAGAGTFTTITASSTMTADGTFDANGIVTLGDGGDTITIDGSSLGLQTTGAGSDITLNAVDQIILTDFANCTALETSSGVLTCGTDDTSAGGGIATIEENNAIVTSSATIIDFLGTDFTVSGASGEGDISIDYANSEITRNNQSETIVNDWTFSLAETEDLAISLSVSGTNAGQAGLVTLTNSSSSGNQYGMYIDNAASTGTTESLLVLDNSDTDTAVTNAIEFVNAGGGFTNLFNVAGTAISSTEFTLLDSGVALSELTDSGTLTAGTVDINGGAIDGVTIGGTSAAAGTFTTLTATSTITADNEGIEFTESDTNPTCSSGNYTIYADTSEGKLKKCMNGTASDLDTGGNPTSVDIRDTTADTLTTSEADILDGTFSIDLDSTTQRVMLVLSIEVLSNGTDDETSTFRLRRGSDCTGTQVGTDMTQFTTTGTLDNFYLAVTFVDAPAATSQEYNVCGLTSTATSSNQSGDIRITATEVAASGADLAEIYTTKEHNIVAGDVVSLDSALPNGVRKSMRAYDSEVLGIVSTQPGLILDDSSLPPGEAVIVALAGRVPVKVTTENGPIKPGDFLTSSSTPGVAMQATKAGQIIGQAMTSFDGEGIGMVTAFVKTDNWAGGGIAELLDADTGQEALGKAVLTQFMSQNQEIASADVSEIVTDRVAAGLEVITPKVTTDIIALNKIEPVETEIVMGLGTDGRFVLQDGTGNTVAAFDDEGNAYFAGTVFADKIKARQIEGLEFLLSDVSDQDTRLLSLESLLATSSATPVPTAAALLVSNSEDGSLTAPPNDAQITIPEASVAGVEENLSVKAATVSGDIRVTGNGLIEGILSVVDTVMTQNFIATGLSTFFDEVLFKGNVEFAGRPSFNRDTAGTAVIREGKTQVYVAFEKEYEAPPIVSASVTNGKFVSYAITDRTTKGFTIVLKEPSADEYMFSWISVAVKNAKTFESD